jgi:hypothetical protein
MVRVLNTPPPPICIVDQTPLGYRFKAAPTPNPLKYGYLNRGFEIEKKLFMAEYVFDSAI